MAVIGGTPSPSLWNEISETVCIDKPTSIGGRPNSPIGAFQIARRISGNSDYGVEADIGIVDGHFRRLRG
jgi:hypothetical protein